MNENELARQLLPLALRVARRMSRDPEDESIAGLALVKALRDFDGRGTIEGYVAYVVRTHVIHRWRKVKVRQKVEHTPYMEYIAVCTDEVTADALLSSEEWQILCEKFELRWPFDVVAKRHGISCRAMKRLIPKLVMRLQEQIYG